MTDLSGSTCESQTSGGNSKVATDDAAVLNCSFCDYTSTNKHYLRQHMDLVHTDDRPFKCPFCDYAGKRSHALKEHLIVHSTERPHQCKQCNATFRKKGHLTNHMRMHSESSSIYDCLICKATSFYNRDRLFTHLRSDHKDLIGEQVFCCNRCQFATTNTSQMQDHETSQHNDYKNIVLVKPKIPPSANIIFKCSSCGFETSYRKDFEKHVLERHSYQHGQGPLIKVRNITLKRVFFYIILHQVDQLMLLFHGPTFLTHLKCWKFISLLAISISLELFLGDSV